MVGQGVILLQGEDILPDGRGAVVMSQKFIKPFGLSSAFPALFINPLKMFTF